MVCTPLDALADVGYTWIQWGGVWHPTDEVHFEYPGFRAPAPQDDDPFLPAAQSFSKLPWFVQLLTPWEISVYASAPAWVRNLLIVPRPIEEIKAVLAMLG
jgi:hypothetical protein